MKVICYRMLGFPAEGLAVSHVLCIPDEKVVLFTERIGRNGEDVYNLAEREDVVNQTKKIAEGLTGGGHTVCDNIITFEYNASRLRRLIADARKRSALELKVKRGIDELLDFARKDGHNP